MVEMQSLVDCFCKYAVSHTGDKHERKMQSQLTAAVAAAVANTPTTHTTIVISKQGTALKYSHKIMRRLLLIYVL